MSETTGSGRIGDIGEQIQTVVDQLPWEQLTEAIERLESATNQASVAAEGSTLPEAAAMIAGLNLARETLQAAREHVALGSAELAAYLVEILAGTGATGGNVLGDSDTVSVIV